MKRLILAVWFAVAADCLGQSTQRFILDGTLPTLGQVEYPVNIIRHSVHPEIINPNQRTWLVIHGWNSSRLKNNIAFLTRAIAQARPNDQVLTLDWSSAADTGALDPFAAESAIVPVAQWAAKALIDYGFQGTNLNLVGHSFGSYIADEISKIIPGDVHAIVALDPAKNIVGGYDPDDEVDFSSHSVFSWAFYSDDPEGPLAVFGDNYGNAETAATADESFIVKNSSHSDVVFLFASMLLNPVNPVNQLFSLNLLVAGAWGPWLQNEFGSYEAIITAGATGETAQSVTYVPEPVLKIERFGDLVTISWPAGSNFVLQSSESLTESTAWQQVLAPVKISGSRAVVSVPSSIGNWFFRLSASGG